MAEPVKKLEVEALKLADKERAELARVLLLSLEDSEDQETELVWAEEAERRYQELTTGTRRPSKRGPERRSAAIRGWRRKPWTGPP